MEKKSITFDLPWPPSINHYYGRGPGGLSFLTPEVKAFRAAVREIVKINDAIRHCHSFKKIRIEITAFPPDNRRRDLDNLSKAVQDAFQEAQLYDDDYNIDSTNTVRGVPYRVKEGDVAINGRLRVRISEWVLPPVAFESESGKEDLSKQMNAIFLSYAKAKADNLAKKKKRAANKKEK